MTGGLSSLWMHPIAVSAGWTMVISLWLTLAIALAFAIWRAMRPSAAPEAQHRVAIVALACCLVLAASAPFALRTAAVSASLAGAVRTGTSAAVTSPSTPSAASAIAVSSAEAIHVPKPKANRVAALAGLFWGVGAFLLLVRLFGGWIVARGVRARACPLVSEPARQCIESLSRDLGVSTPALLMSAEVEAPVAIGWRSPALIVPDDLPEQLGQDALLPLLGHELAHVKRRDYAANLVQAVVEALLFFSPAVWWISRTIREAREYCCDDLAVRCCAGDRRRYVQVLTGMAALGSRNRQRLAVAAAGPRLIVRIRRLITESAMPRRSPLKLAVLATASVALLVLAPPIGRITTVGLAQAATPQQTAVDVDVDPVPINWIPRQPGSPVKLGPVVASDDHQSVRVGIANDTDTAVQGIQLVVVFDARSGSAPSGVYLLSLPSHDIHLPAGGDVELEIDPASPERLREARRVLGPSVQLSIGVQAVTFANGAQWSIAPNPSARHASEAFGMPPAELPRALVGAAPPEGAVPGLCYDREQREFSEGALVPIRGEPGRFARCVEGTWIDDDIARPAGGSPARPDDSPGEVVSGVPGDAAAVIARETVAEPGVADVMPVAIKVVRPRHTPEARQQRLQGSVHVEARIATDGTVKDAVVVRGASSGVLNEAAVAAARQWVFKPALKAGKPVEVVVTLEFTFVMPPS